MKNFGKQAKDKITGFKGIITARADYMYGCGQYYLNPPVDKEGKKQAGNWFDEGRIEILKQMVKPEDVKVEKGGCEFREHPDKE